MHIGIYQPYWGGIGGGQRYLGAVAEVLAADQEVEIVHHRADFQRAAIEEALELDLSRVRFRLVAPITRPEANGFNPWTRFAAERAWGAELSRPYDLFINCTSTVPFFCHARRGVLVTYFPETSRDQFQGRGSPEWRRKPLPIRAATRVYQAVEWRRRYATYAACLTCSDYSRGWLKKLWGIEASVVYPPVREGFQPKDKNPLILSIGRFHGSQHKKQDALIHTFQKLHDQGLRDWRYVMVGPLEDNPEDRVYLEQLRAVAGDYPIDFRTNLPARELRELLEQAAVLWHAMGYGVDAQRNPGRLEHFGMVGAEAMAAGCVPMLFHGGGLREIVRHEQDGYLWRTTEELAALTLRLAGDAALRAGLASAARSGVQRFSREAFAIRLRAVVAPLLNLG